MSSWTLPWRQTAPFNDNWRTQGRERVLVEVAGVEPASSTISIGLLRAQALEAFAEPPSSAPLRYD